MKTSKTHLNSAQALTKVIGDLGQCSLDGAYEVTIKRLPQTRTGQQRRAIEVYCRELAISFNDAGLTVQEVLSHTLDCEWSQEMVKHAMFKKASVAMLDKSSSTDLTISEVSSVYDTVNRFAAKFGIHVPFPEKKEAA